MGHIDEDKFAEDFALSWLRGHFPNGTLRREEWLGDDDKPFVDYPTEGYADAWVTPDTTRKIDPAVYLAVEIGNDDTVRDECAQAVEYASVHDRAVPYVIIPANHADENAVEAFRCRGVVVIELSTQ